MSLKEAFHIITEGGSVSRYHTKRVIKTQSVAHHSHAVAMWCELLTGGQASKKLIMAALTHDMAEFRTGDMPSPTKRALGIQEQFGELERSILAPEGLGFEFELDEAEKRTLTLTLADQFDGLVYCAQEIRMGNAELKPTYERYRDYYLSMTPMFQERELLEIVDRYKGGER